MKHLSIFLIVIFSVTNFVSAQGNNNPHDTLELTKRQHRQHLKNDIVKNAKPDSNGVYPFTEQMPHYNGNMNKVIRDSLNWPPQEDMFVGSVYITFIVEMDGTISNIKVLRGIRGAPLMDKEAIRVVSLLKSWTPGMQNGKPVRVRYNLPIRFKRQ